MSLLEFDKENELFRVNAIIARAPSKVLMIRELTKNCIEAIESVEDYSQKSRHKRKLIAFKKTDPAIFGLSGYSTSKLGVFNTGRSMNAKELVKATQLSASVNKTQGLKKNFGIGAKVSALGVNQAGMIWVSCNNGIVNRVVLRKTVDEKGNDVYERQEFADSTGKMHDIVDITNLFSVASNVSSLVDFGGKNHSFLSTAEDWTYITLCGNTPEQDTIFQPFETTVSSGWLTNDLYKRFFDIPTDIEIRSEIHNSGDKIIDVPFECFNQRWTKLTSEKKQLDLMNECVTIDNGIKIHYYWDGPAPALSNGYVMPISVYHHKNRTPSFFALIYNKEFYGIMGAGQKNASDDHQRVARECGYFYGSKFVRVYVEIPDNFPVISNEYREYIQTDDSEKVQLEVLSFAKDIAKNTPVWLKEKMKSHMPPPLDVGDIKTAMKKYVEQTRYQLSPSYTGMIGAYKNESDEKKPGKKKDDVLLDPSIFPQPVLIKAGGTYPLKQNPTGNYIRKIIYPDPVFLKTDADINSASVTSDFKNRAAEYVENNSGTKQSATLFVNGQYPVIEAIAKTLTYEYQNHPQLSKLFDEAIGIALYFTALSIGIHLTLAQMKKDTTGYTPQNYTSMTDSSVLTCIAEMWNDRLQEMKIVFLRRTLDIRNQQKIAA